MFQTSWIIFTEQHKRLIIQKFGLIKYNFVHVFQILWSRNWIEYSKFVNLDNRLTQIWKANVIYAWLRSINLNDVITH